MANSLTYEVIKRRIKYLHEHHPNIHVNVKMAHPRSSLENVSAVITEVYPNIFVLTEKSKGYTERYSFKYSDVLTGEIEIIEFAKFKQDIFREKMVIFRFAKKDDSICYKESY